jgi:hypothetical protein
MRTRVQIRTLQVISPRRTPSRSRLVNTMKRSYMRQGGVDRSRRLVRSTRDERALCDKWRGVHVWRVRPRAERLPPAARLIEPGRATGLK